MDRIDGKFESTESGLPLPWRSLFLLCASITGICLPIIMMRSL